MGGHLMESGEAVGFPMPSGALVLVGMVSTVPVGRRSHTAV